MKNNIKTLGEYTEKLVPVVAGTAAAYIVVPCLTGALAFVTVGTKVVGVTYSFSKIAIMGTGVMLIAKKIQKIVDNTVSDSNVTSNGNILFCKSKESEYSFST